MMLPSPPPFTPSPTSSTSSVFLLTPPLLPLSLVFLPTLPNGSPNLPLPISVPTHGGPMAPSTSRAGSFGLIYKVSPNLFGKSMPTPRFVHPFHSHLVYFQNEDGLFSFNVLTGKVETRISSTRDMSVLPMLLPNWPSPLPKALYAAYAKELGNECFKSCNFSQAIECYTKSIDLSPNTLSFANRPTSYLKVNKFQEAENDCTESLKLDANNFKVYWRRALARKELGDLEGALKDVEFGLKLEPQNNQFRNLCVELKSMLDKDTCAEREYGEKDAAGDV